MHIFSTSIPATLFCTLMNLEMLINPGCFHFARVYRQEAEKNMTNLALIARQRLRR